MRDCSVCGLWKVETTRGKALCSECRRQNRLAAQKRYRDSPEGRAYMRAYWQSPKAKERHRELERIRIQALSPEQRERRREAVRRYRQTENGKTVTLRVATAQYYRLKDDPVYRARHKVAFRRYATTDKGRAALAVSAHKRRAAKFGSEFPLTAADWRDILAAAEGRCHYCGKIPAKLTQDHVVPLSRGGAHSRDNVVPACQPCNSKKGAWV